MYMKYYGDINKPIRDLKHPLIVGMPKVHDQLHLPLRGGYESQDLVVQQPMFD